MQLWHYSNFTSPSSIYTHPAIQLNNEKILAKGFSKVELTAETHPDRKVIHQRNFKVSKVKKSVFCYSPFTALFLDHLTSKK